MLERPKYRDGMNTEKLEYLLVELFKYSIYLHVAAIFVPKDQRDKMAISQSS